MTLDSAMTGLEDCRDSGVPTEILLQAELSQAEPSWKISGFENAMWLMILLAVLILDSV